MELFRSATLDSLKCDHENSTSLLFCTNLRGHPFKEHYKDYVYLN